MDGDGPRQTGRRDRCRWDDGYKIFIEYDNGTSPFEGEIVLIMWGSLIIQPGIELNKNLNKTFWWGPMLPIGLVRQSLIRESLSRVVFENASLENTVVRTFCSNVGLNNAIKLLREREGISENNKENIGYINFKTGKSRCKIDKVKNLLQQWGRDVRAKAIIWTDLSSNIGLNNTMDGKARSNKVITLLKTDQTLFEKTKDYIKLIPIEMRSNLEKDILNARSNAKLELR